MEAARARRPVELVAAPGRAPRRVIYMSGMAAEDAVGWRDRERLPRERCLTWLSGGHERVTTAPAAASGPRQDWHADVERRHALNDAGREPRVQIDAHVFMANRDKAAALAGVRPSRVEYWARTGLIEPSVDERLTPGRPIRLYSYMELLAVMIVAEMRRRDVSLQHIRTVVERVRAQGVDNPLTEVRYAVVGRRLYLQDEHGRWEDGDVPGQGVIAEVLDLRPLQARITASVARPDRAIGAVERRRRTRGSTEVFAGTRIPVQTVRRYLEAGRSAAEVLEAYPLLTLRDIEAVRSSGAA